LHVQDPMLGVAAQHEGFDLARDTDEALQRFIGSTWPAADCSPQRHTVTGTAKEAVLSTAHRVDAQVVVVGSRGMSRVERLVFGSTTEGVLRHADVSVLVAPAMWTPPRAATGDLTGVGPVVVGVDVTDASTATAKAACGLASLLGTSLTAVSVVPELRVLSDWDGFAKRAVQDRAEAVRRELKALIDGLGCSVPVEMRVEVGRVADALADAATPGPRLAPILVLGKAAGGIGNAPGAIAYRVLSRVDVPVLMLGGRLVT
jgi:nucleotide-binding universal stress UspA family protein